MILEEVMCQIRDEMMLSGLVNKFYEYCEQIQRGDITYPAYYDKGGGYLPVYDFDINGAGYIRKRGDVRITRDELMTSMVACVEDNDFIDVIYPLRAVVGVPKTKLEDSAYSDELLFHHMIQVLGNTYTATNVQGVHTLVTGYNTDSLTLWKQEVQGIDYQMLFTLSYISVDFDLIFNLKRSCLLEACAY